MNLDNYIDENNPLLKKALTHSSYINEKGGESYERLEFLGDAILQMVITQYLYENTKSSEGDMSKIRAIYVCESALYEYSKKLNIVNDIKVGQGLHNKPNETIVADVFESIVAAIYLTNGYNKVKDFILTMIVPYIEKGIVFSSDYKSRLQEMVQTEKNSVTYNVIKEIGPSHNKTYKVEVLVNNIVYGQGIGKSKKEAEQQAAKDAINKKAGE